MEQHGLENRLADLPLGEVRYFDRLGSTNDEAKHWAEEGAPDLSVVVADEQTAGRGRAGRRWTTPAGAGLAFSLILYPTLEGSDTLPRMTALGALAVCDALRNVYRLPAQIKWPNDVLLNRWKVAGVLAEAHWTGGDLTSVVLGVGINVASASVSEAVLPASNLLFPAICVEDALGRPVDSLELLHAVLAEFLRWRQRLSWSDFMRAWEASLAFRGEWVHIFSDQRDEETKASLEAPIQEGQIAGLAPDGSLRLTTRSGDEITVRFGEVRLRPIDKA
jgi:BirA family biotin operon repressor/biotin-[acetyl-CoA-carboxylase] ligase